MSGKQEPHPFLRRPFYVFDLPPELLLSLSLKSTNASHREEPESTPNQPDVPLSISSQDDGSQSTSCSLCKATFKTLQDQRLHVKSDFHRYNLKLALKQMPAIDEATFIRMIGELDESISGSDSSGSEEDNDVNFDPLSSLLKKQAKLSAPASTFPSRTSHKQVTDNAPMFWLSSSLIGEDQVLGVYRALFQTEIQEGKEISVLDSLRQRQLVPVQAKSSGNARANGLQKGTESDPHFFLCMIGGGHFAAMVVSLIPEVRRGAGGVEERHAIVRAHKTFHRYTTRRKQGGSQSANDNAKGNAHSVGSSIRRANEVALEAEIRAVLSDWRTMIDSAELLFVRASGSTNRRTLFGPYDGQVLSIKDKRLRSFPFTTRRATQAELLRAFQELTRLKLSQLLEKPVQEPELPPKAPTPRKKPEAPVRSKEDEEAHLHTTQMQNLIRRSKAPGLLLYLSKNSLSPNFEFFPKSDHHHAPTPLHLSASTSSPALVLALVTKANADPTITNFEGKTAYDLAGDKRTRDSFRVARHTLGESAVDWSAAHVPEGISQADADARAQVERLETEKAEEERRKADLENIRLEEDQRSAHKIERKHGAGHALPIAGEKTGSEKREADVRGLTPEMRMKLERERRARAAEERMRRMQGGQ